MNGQKIHTQKRPRFVSELLITVLAEVGCEIAKQIAKKAVLQLRKILCPKLHAKAKEYEEEKQLRQIPDDDLFE